jgi:hypothetical protein
MASGVELRGAMMHSVHSIEDAPPPEARMSTDCHFGGSPCCALGQCLLGIVVAGEASFPAQPRLRPSPQPASVLSGSLVDAPFRPPAVA